MVNMQSSTLYLTGNPDTDKPTEIVLLPASSLVVIFTLEVSCPKSTAFNISFVKSPEQKCEDKSPEEDPFLFPVPLDTISFNVSFISSEECPSMVCKTELPAVLCPEDSWCIVGMSAALRYLLKLTVDAEDNKVSETLLGFRGGCLQSCSEVSCWTKFCEIEAPDALKEIYSGILCSEFPRTLLRFDYHLSCPPILHNALKRKQQHIRKTVKDKEERDRLLSLKLHELPDLDHQYAEGLDVSLADIMLLICFDLIIHKVNHINFNDTTPLVMKWMQLISNISYVSSALKLLSLVKSRVTSTSNMECDNIFTPEIKKESLYKSDPDKVKQFIGVSTTYQQSISSSISLFDSKGLKVTYAEKTELQKQALPWSELPKFVHPQEGELPKSRLERKCQQLDNLVNMVLSVAKDGDEIVDFCAGGGHVAIVLAHFLPNCKILLVENKSSSLLRAKKRVLALGYTNVEFYQCNLDYFKGTFDIGVCLHACGQATDLVLQKCFKQKASFVCSPCCYGAIQPNHSVGYPRSDLYKSLLERIEDYLHLGHGADQTHGPDHPSTPQGQLCMRLIDGDRLEHARELGYESCLYMMEPSSCSPKNHILVGKMKSDH